MRLILAAFLCVCAATVAHAEDCKPQKIVNVLPIQATGSRFTIPVSLNGVEKHFLFDTGGQLPQVSAAVADELNLPRRESRLTMHSVDGKKSDSYAVVDKFKLGMFAPVQFPMTIAADTTGGIDGIFTPVGMTGYDFDMDFAGGKINMLSADHCEGKVIYWPAKAAAAVPISVQNRHLTVPVMLDGHEFTAMIDTGAFTTILRMDMARAAFDLGPDSPGMKSAGNVNRNSAALLYRYPFKNLSFAGISVTNPQVGILDVVNQRTDDIMNGSSHPLDKNENLNWPEITIGMDVLSKLHLYLAQKEGKLYLTEADTPAAAPP